MGAEMAADINKLRAYLESEWKRLTEELEQLKAGVSSPEQRREGSPFGKREEEATEALELEKRLVLENRIRQELAGACRPRQRLHAAGTVPAQQLGLAEAAEGVGQGHGREVGIPLHAGLQAVQQGAWHLGGGRTGFA